MRTPIFKLALVPVLLSTLIACSAGQDGNNATAEPVKSAEPTREAAGPGVAAGEIRHYENIVISDWMDEDTVVVSKENDKLGKMSLEELADSLPKACTSTTWIPKNLN